MLGYVTDPTAPGGLRRAQLDEPAAGPGEMLVHVRAFALNRGELRLLVDRPDGWHPGQDVAGVVVAGDGPPPGTRVVAIADQGGWSERVAVPSHRVAPIPDGVSFADAASLPVAGLTALRALRAGGQRLGSAVLVTGASGGVGAFAVQLAKAGGATVTGLVSGPGRVDAARAAGADRVVTALGAGDRFDVALDGVGGQVLVEAVRHLVPGGTAVAYGAAGGREPAQLGFWEFPPLARLIGFFVYATGEETFGADLELLAAMVGDGRLQPPVGEIRDWSQAVAAVEALRERAVTGKVVCTLGAQS
jgi:NADPH:quinone reductase-like Zn-dependent oxidoreductase